jgi:hypothetical protein
MIRYLLTYSPTHLLTCLANKKSPSEGTLAFRWARLDTRRGGLYSIPVKKSLVVGRESLVRTVNFPIPH